MYIPVLVLHCISVILASYQKQKLWSERCKRNSYVLNDCNWCWCNNNQHYTCTARVCDQVDMFGHFKDAIQEMDLGMEGHGAWRSTLSSCEAGVEYRRGTVRCICDEDGNWPNPVCRDLFRVLYPVEVAADVQQVTPQSCAPTKLYLVGCNVCFCPSAGKLAAHLCTNRPCSQNDPVLTPRESTVTRSAVRVGVKPDLQIYVTCQRRKMYNIGCRRCKCVGNNRLVCDQCAKDQPLAQNTSWAAEIKETLCSGKVGSVIKIDCNHCLCATIDDMYCTTKKCLPKHEQLFDMTSRAWWQFWKWFDGDSGSSKTSTTTETATTLGPPLIDAHNCTFGTVFYDGCHVCSCLPQGDLVNTEHVVICRKAACNRSTFDSMMKDCVANTNYELDCLLCQCLEKPAGKYEVCKESGRCAKVDTKGIRPRNLDLMHGYCEPLHLYEKDCNRCKCLANGKIAKCTTKFCVARTAQAVSVNIAPLQSDGESCPKGHVYKIDCNICFCLSNGNALCTTANCASPRRTQTNRTSFIV